MEYLLWSVTWVNVQLMLADAPRFVPSKKDDKGNPKPVSKKVKTKDDISKLLEKVNRI